MSKPGATSQTPTSPGSAGAATVQVRTNAVPLRQSTEVASKLESIHHISRRNGCPRSFPSFESWPAELDDELRRFILSTPGAERQAIAAIRSSHSEIPEDLIWSRIIYLGLTNRKRAPYRKHEWTAEEDEILITQYGSSRAASRNAIEHILTLHPDWSRDAVVWRARVLGLTQHRTTAPQRWSSTQDHYLLSLMSLAMEGKLQADGLQAINEDDDLLTAMARELVTRQGVGEQAAEVWRSLQMRHSEVSPPTDAVILLPTDPPLIQEEDREEPRHWIDPASPAVQLSLF